MTHPSPQPAGAAGPPPAEEDIRWLEIAVERARRNVAEGGGPFAAVVVEDGRVLGEGTNRVTRDNDPTAHGEVCAIRAAATARGDFRLHGTVLYTSCEPCPLCLAAALWARVDRVVFAADRHAAARAGFDDRAFHDLFVPRESGWPMAVTRREVPGMDAPFDDWLAHDSRVSY
ncbi:nucleoside deaminase [Georgenia sp. MJ173]|uniref:nucleoside deaminase n=1 Tax=Georgenia sunbinii TaxID=3117728 RepID=UPI002F25FDDE